MTDFERSWAERGMIGVAGSISLRYARSRRYVARHEQVAIHEAGHAIVALAVGDHLHHLTIVPKPHLMTEDGRQYTVGSCVSSKSPVLKGTLAQLDRRSPKTDVTAVIQMAILLTELTPDEPAKCFRWLRTIRALRALSKGVIEDNWPFIDSLAIELVRKQDMGQAEISEWLQGFRSKITAIDSVELDTVLESICSGGKLDELQSAREVA
jgi:hypothetical protein